MDRRRYVPKAEGLEGRSLLSIFGGGTNNPLTPTDPTSVTANTLRQKADRIDHLPYFMLQLQPGRQIPPAILEHIQADLFTIVTRLQPTRGNVVNQFNLQLRSVISNTSLSSGDVAGLSNRFGAVLTKAGAPPDIVSRFQADMGQLAQVDANSTNPTILAANDYGLVLQVALGVGQPLPRPVKPTLAASDNTGSQVDRITTVRQPHLNGTYDAGATLQIINTDTGQVIGSGTVANTGSYSIQVDTPLADGTYNLGVRANDLGILSAVSAPVKITIRTADSHPKGPLASSSKH